MLEVVSNYCVCFITQIVNCYLFSKLLNERLKKGIKTFLIFIVTSLATYYSEILLNDFIKLITTNICCFIMLKIIFKKETSKTLLATLFISISYIFAEAIFALIFLVILNLSADFFVDTLLGTLIFNIFEFGLTIILLNIKKLQRIIFKIISWNENNKIFNLAISIILAMIICYIFLYYVTFDKLDANLQLIIFSVLIGIIVFIVGYFNQKSTNNRLIIKYDNLLDYVKDYEKEVVEKGKVIHEHKNQLAVIDGMIPKNNKKLKKYVEDKIDTINRLDDNVWLEKLTNLPEGGIKGLVYLKIKRMLDNNIAIFIDIDDKLKTKNKWKSINDNLEDYTRILGVYLDNAIEASIESNDKQIVLEFIDNKDNIEFVLSNTYKGNINFSDIDKEKFSTKGKGRGYGLSLVKDIINNNKLIEQSREINGKFYVQKLMIKK